MYSKFPVSKASQKKFSHVGTFADLLVRHVRARGGDAPSVYTAAHIDRRTYSSIISHPFRPVAKRTAVQFAIALKLARSEADTLLQAAGFALSPAIPEDIVFAEAIAAGGGDLQAVDQRLFDCGMKTIT